MKISIVLPTKNERGNAVDLCEKLRYVKEHEQKLFGNDIELHEAIFVLNRSTDGTEGVLKDIQSQSGYEFVKTDWSTGRGSAIRKGVELAQGDYVVVMDSDGEYNPRLLGKLTRPITRLGYDMSVINDKDERSFIRCLLSNSFQLFTDKLVGTKYVQAGFKAGKKEVLLDTIPKGVSGLDIDIRWMSNVVEKGYKISNDLTVKIQPRKYGKTSFNPFILAVALFYTAANVYLKKRIGKELPFPKILKRHMLYSSE